MGEPAVAATVTDDTQARQTVLLVDDNATNLQVLYQTLRDLGPRVLIARSGESALSIARETVPDLVLLDIMMPGMDGYEVCRSLKGEPATRDAAVIFLSALGDTGDKVRGFGLGAVDFISKPFQGEEVLARVRTHLKIRRLERDLSARNRRLEAQQRHILESMGEGLFGVDGGGTIIYANPAALRITGRELEDLEGADLFDADWLETSGDESGRCLMRDAILGESARPCEHEGVVRRPGGAGIEVDFSAAPFHLDGAVRGAVMTFRDVSRRKRAEIELKTAHDALLKSHMELRHAQDRLVQAAKLESVGRLAAGVAHEVKNPLAIIQMGIDYLKVAQRSPGDPGSQVLADMEDAVARADRVIRGLLNLSREQVARTAPADLNEVIDKSLGMVRHELTQHNISLDTDLQPGPATTLLDVPKIEQVLINLFMNAVHAIGRDGLLHVSTRTVDLTEEVVYEAGIGNVFGAGDRALVLEITDTGTGIPEAELERVFDPFFTTKPVGKGTGLGLSVTRTIIEMHRGAIELRNRSRQTGVRVTIYLQTHESDKT
ncbi:MAG: response regulator [Pseudomonadota bacterium]|nr:response regulator [Pseudomonadota bacterium]